jgi:hypothetical protein
MSTGDGKVAARCLAFATRHRSSLEHFQYGTRLNGHVVARDTTTGKYISLGSSPSDIPFGKPQYDTLRSQRIAIHAMPAWMRPDLKLLAPFDAGAVRFVRMPLDKEPALIARLHHCIFDVFTKTIATRMKVEGIASDASVAIARAMVLRLCAASGDMCVLQALQIAAENDGIEIQVGSLEFLCVDNSWDTEYGVAPGCVNLQMS